MNSIRRRRTMLMTAQSYDCIVALYLHNIFLFTSLLVEFYFSIWTCIWWGKNLLFFSIVYILFILSVCMKIKRWLILFSYSYFACTWNENGIKYWKMCMHWFSSDIVQWMTTKIRLQRIMYQLWSMSLSEIFLWLNLQYVYF